MSEVDHSSETADIDIVGGSVVVDGALAPGNVSIRGGRIVSIGTWPGRRSAETATIDASGMIIAPGLVDLQCNGAGGVDVTREPDRIADVAAVLPRFGVTSFLPTVVTAPAERRAAAIEAMRSLAERSVSGARPLGLHFEGPAISPAHLGAHDPAFQRAPAAIADEIQSWVASGVVSMVTLAPELDGAIDAIAELVDAGALVFGGHTAMSAKELATAKAAGLRGVTHLFNAMAPFGHRSPGPVGAVLADDDVAASVICDGVHVDPVAVRVAWRALGDDRVVLVSDASAPLGQPYGRFRLGRRELVHDQTGVRTVDGVLAGSALPLDQAVRNLVRFTGCSRLGAIAAATATPAALLGRDDIGRLAVGGRGDVIVLDDELEVRTTIVGGTVTWQADGDDADAISGDEAATWKS